MNLDKLEKELNKSNNVNLINLKCKNPSQFSFRIDESIIDTKVKVNKNCRVDHDKFDVVMDVGIYESMKNNYIERQDDREIKAKSKKAYNFFGN